MTQTSVHASAPGKLYIAGEYAVVHPGHAALLIAVDRYVHVTLTPTGTTTGTLRSDASDPTKPDEAPVRWEASTDPTAAARFHTDETGFHKYVAAAVLTVERWRAEKHLPTSGYDIDISSHLDDATSGAKFGLGSSAAVTVAAVVAVARYHRLQPTPEQIYRLAAIATVRVTTKTSGGDVAASALGGWVEYHSPDRTWLEDRAWGASSRTTTISDLLTGDWPGLSLRRIVPAAPGIQLSVGWTGTPADTTELVGHVVKKTALPDDLLQRSDAAVGSLVASLTSENGGCEPDRGDADSNNRATTATGHAVAQARQVLGEIATQRGVAIETPALRTLITSALDEGWWAKSSGAGGGDCGIALTAPGVDAHALHERWTAAGIRPLNLHVSPTGAETAPALVRDLNSAAPHAREDEHNRTPIAGDTSTEGDGK
ncbi:phosphomevalonate kinase [uncultured Corynebacterium sp.]|uniref:phosphomevalonate kinase n=1 Tax=uncultured Corynebacterium sp. TaxID=159447 RepID=UPI0025E4D05E|nr:phosphomevalonate kinase [uncultured Corynebacterium sp.]